jgi:hypothetical protein
MTLSFRGRRMSMAMASRARLRNVAMVMRLYGPDTWVTGVRPISFRLGIGLQIAVLLKTGGRREYVKSPLGVEGTQLSGDRVVLRGHPFWRASRPPSGRRKAKPCTSR